MRGVSSFFVVLDMTLADARKTRVESGTVYVDCWLLMLILSLRKCENGYIGDSVVVIAVRRRWASTSWLE